MAAAWGQTSGRRSIRKFAATTAKAKGERLATRCYPRVLHGFGVYHTDQLLPLKTVSLEDLGRPLPLSWLSYGPSTYNDSAFSSQHYGYRFVGLGKRR